MEKIISFILSIALLLTVFTACSSNAQSAPTSSTADQQHTVTLASETEPGQRLRLHGMVVDSQTQQPIPNAEIYLYHADANGEYLPSDPADESTAKLSGTVTTGTDGSFAVHTIVPREYDQPGNRHIHLHYVQADGYLQLGGVILFEDDVNNEIRQWANDTGFGIIIDLEEENGIQVGNISLLLEPAP